MPVSQTEAADALRDIRDAERRSSSLYGYRLASPHLILWGVIWMVGYGTTYVRPGWSDLWLALVAVGLAGSFWVGARVKPGARPDWRYGATALAVGIFVVAVFAVLPPTRGAQSGAFFPILAALYYALIGIWTRGARMLIAGIVLLALTLFGFFYLPHQFLLWMAVVGGGGLVLGGIWLRTA
jgi:hypothetical protein